MAAYFDDADLAHFGDLKQHAPELWSAFERYYAAAFEPGLLTKREKVLVGFAVAQVSQCPYCIDSYTQTALEQGLTMKHLAEAMHAAVTVPRCQSPCTQIFTALPPVPIHWPEETQRS